ncbi:MAG: hypothetical protein H7A43_02295 [Verrucomicrobia bacterium]|nr:hypothetical protein [Kiritimatiellia bacterium]MCP5487453.1 hypothetical protein [Verrucomicrobiota bacterium]
MKDFIFPWRSRSSRQILSVVGNDRFGLPFIPLAEQQDEAAYDNKNAPQENDVHPPRIHPAQRRQSDHHPQHNAKQSDHRQKCRYAMSIRDHSSSGINRLLTPASSSSTQTLNTEESRHEWQAHRLLCASHPISGPHKGTDPDNLKLALEKFGVRMGA